MTWLEKQVRKSQLLQIGLCLAAVAAVIGLLAASHRFYQNYFAGPFDIPPAELAATTRADALPRYWVRVTPRQLVDSGVDNITVRTRRGRETGRSVTGHYWFAVIEDRLMVVSAPGKSLASDQPLQGVVRQVPADLSAHMKQVLKPEFQSRMMPVMLDTSDFSVDWAQIGLVGAGFVTAGALLWAAVATRRAIAPGGHHALAALTRGGVELEAASRAIEEAVRSKNVVKLGGRTLTHNFILKTGLGFDIRPNSDLLWAYTITTTHKIYGIIPTGRSHQIALHYPKEKVLQKIDATTADRSMAGLAQVSPWTFLGWSAELDEAWRKNRPTLANAVAERRAAVHVHWAAAAAGTPAGGATATGDAAGEGGTAAGPPTGGHG